MRPLYRGSSMKGQKSPKRQTAQKKKEKPLSAIWKAFSVAGSCLFRISCGMVLLAMISLLFIYLYGCLLKSPYFRLEQVTVTGLEASEKGELLESAGLQGDLSLLTINLNELKESLEKRPWIRRVHLEKQFFHALSIEVEKERVWALVSDGGLYCMNRWGEVFTEADETGDLDYPIVTGIEREEEDRNAQLMCAVEVLGLLEKEGAPWSLDELSELHVRKDGHVALYFSSLPLVIKIRGNELSHRIHDLRKLVKHLKDTGRISMVKGINMDYEDAAVVSFRKG